MNLIYSSYWEIHSLLPVGDLVDSARELVLSIHVWVLFTNIASILQSMVEINWLANLVGILVCFDETTVRRDMSGSVRALIEVKPNRQLSSVLLVEPADRQVARVEVDYKWKPFVCSNCHSFGHIAEACKHSPCSCPLLNIGNIDFNFPTLWKIPLPKVNKWV